MLPRPNPRWGAWRWLFGACLWAVLLSAGFASLYRYAFTPGAPALPPPHWPSDSALVHRPGRPTLVMLAHPQCSCTHASLRELERLMAEVAGRLDTFVVFVTPQGDGSPMVDGDLWRLASGIPGVGVTSDPDGEEARRFRAHTAGQVILYDGAGQLAYVGGITGARGHEGDSAGHSSIVALALGKAAADSQGPVFGCRLGADPMLPGRP